MRGKPGSKIVVTIVRPGRDKPFDVSLTRELIQLKPVKWEVKNEVGIININTFVNSTTGDSVRAAISGIQKSLGGRDPLGYIVDLRSNPGGLLDQAIDVSDIFLERGEIVSQRGREKTGATPPRAISPMACRSSCWSMPGRLRRRKSSRAHCRIRSARW